MKKSDNIWESLNKSDSEKKNYARKSNRLPAGPY